MKASTTLGCLVLAAMVLLSLIVVPALQFAFAADEFVNGQAASIVLGRRDFFTWGWDSSALGANSFYFPAGVAVDSSGNVWVLDVFRSRVLQFRSPSRTDSRHRS